MSFDPINLSLWFLDAYDRRTLPTPPFELRPAITVISDRYFEQLKFEVEKAIEGNETPRFKTGALQHDLFDLHRLTQAIMTEQKSPG